jgi:rhamnogalacturonyl hydrolase YesR
VLNLAIDFCLKHNEAQGAVMDGNTTTEGVYIAGYPLAVMGRAHERDDLALLALLQLRARRDRNVQNGTIFQAVDADGKGRLPNWARGVAWYLLGFARVLDVLNPGAQADDLYQEFQRAAEWAMKFQQADGLWRNFFDDLNSARDTSGSAGIATALALGARRGWLPDSARTAAASTCIGLEAHLTPDGFLGGVAQFNKGGEALQRANYRVMAPMAMGLAAQLRAELQGSRAEL